MCDILLDYGGLSVEKTGPRAVVLYDMAAEPMDIPLDEPAIRCLIDTLAPLVAKWDHEDAVERDRQKLLAWDIGGNT